MSDYNGPDVFTFEVSDGTGRASADVAITVHPVDDWPELPELPDQLVHAGEVISPIILPDRDRDGDELTYDVEIADTSVAVAAVGTAGVNRSNALFITGMNRGYTTATTKVQVTVSDGRHQVARSFAVSVVPPPPPAPTGLWAEPNDGEVDLTWQPSPGARAYLVRWSASYPPSLPGGDWTTSGIAARVGGVQVAEVTVPSFSNGDLTNLVTYRYVVSAVGDGGEGPLSAEVRAEPGPVPAPVPWAVAVGSAVTDTIQWAPAHDATGYRVYFSTSRDALQGRRPAADFIQINDSPAEVQHRDKTLGIATYYRVIGVNGTRIGTGGPIAYSTAFTSTATDAPFVSPALWDIDGDGCLDMVGARGDCRGGFHSEPLSSLGLAGLFAEGRINRDSRFADFNGDGYVDIFTNVYSRADDADSRAILHVNDGTGHFTEDPGVAAMQIGGFGETVVAADFNNDGFVDLFIPHYWDRNDGGHNWLLINDGKGHFIDRALEAGVATGPMVYPYTPEGAQAIDFNLDGWVDLFVASHLFINNHDGTFTNIARGINFPIEFDEGASLVDVDGDGAFDFVLSNPTRLLVYRNVNGVFAPGETLDQARDGAYGYGFAICDLNGDDLPDVIVSRFDPNTQMGGPVFLINVNGSFVHSETGLARGGYSDIMTCADLDGNGSADVLIRWPGYHVLRNGASNPTSFRIRLLGPAGQRNQQGRVLHIEPRAAPGRVFARVVESGSNYLAQGDYDVRVGAPLPGEYVITVFLAGRTIQATTTQGQDITIYTDGRVVPGLH